MLNLKRFAIFSLKGFDRDFVFNGTIKVLKSKGYGYKVVKGSYKGTLETSILVVCDDDATLDWIRETAFKDGKESILVVDEHRRAILEYNNLSDYLRIPQVQKIGMFQSITPIQATELDNWTLDGTDYYGVL